MKTNRRSFFVITLGAIAGAFCPKRAKAREGYSAARLKQLDECQAYIEQRLPYLVDVESEDRILYGGNVPRLRVRWPEWTAPYRAELRANIGPVRLR